MIFKIYLLFIYCTIISSLRILKLGFLFPLHSKTLYNISGFNLSAGAVSIAIDKIKKEQILPNFNFTVEVKFDECVPTKATGLTDQLVRSNVDVIIGPTCSRSATKSSLHATFFNKPTITWGISANSDYSNTKRLPNLITINPLISPIIITLLDVLKTFKWYDISLIATTNELGRCSNIRKGIENAIQTETGLLTIKTSYEATIPPNDEVYDHFLEDTKLNARIIVACFDSDYWRRKFFLKMFDHGMDNGYANKLKNEVDSRSREIQEEQKKSNILLQKMLPPQISEKLKLGIHVPPENFDNVTVFFSDIVKFTTFSQKCSPFQVVNILNELFSQFDNIIEGLDVYKVETTGDGYLCVSGLPHYNGNNHVIEIAKLALGFIKTCQEFKIIHLPDEKIMLRIGCNTGPCTAGVVGLSMPRYCLFGDTVNTASRMESNGKSGRIHTTESFYLLLSTFGNFVMEHRGEVIIKGKGVMNTYWLNGMKNV
uniref:Heat-stable enterotoxin receptor (inferred by orthology to a human protein) n=1 Tax=Strongyloides venezuelensis TaxID=75913 RepID=A0A0K0FAK7_STRVS